MRVSLCMIVRNEEKLLPRVLESVQDIVDEIIVVDTGSTDNTVAVAESFGTPSRPVVVKHFDWIDDFAAARNFSFSLATGDWLFWLDADDVVPRAREMRDLVEKFERERPGEVDVFQFPYHYAHDEYGNLTMLLHRERFLRAGRGWRWVEPIHEHVDYPPGTKVYSDFELPVIHQTDRETGVRSRDRNLKILKNLIAAAGGLNYASPRHLVYLAEESRVNGDMHTCEKAYEAYLARSEWSEERSQVFCKLARIALMCGNTERAARLTQQALELTPHWPDPHIAMAELDYARREFDRALVWLGFAESLSPPKTMLITNPMDYSFTPGWLRAQCLKQLGRVDEAHAVLVKLVAIRPDVTEPELAAVETEIMRRKRVNAAAILAPDLSVAALSDLPPSVTAEPMIQSIAYRKLQKKPDPSRRSVAIYTGPHWESWCEKSLVSGGIGGSETAVIQVANHLAAKGLDVTVYGEPGPNVGRRGSVFWAPYHCFEPDRAVDLFISSRVAEVFDLPVCAKEKWLWLHDVSLGDTLTPERIEKVDRFLTLSDWQSRAYRANYGIPEGKIYRIRNGIDPELFMKAVKSLESIFTNELPKKDPYRFVWSSSPDRGLEDLLLMWPDIIRMQPSAALHIYYGWDNIERAAEYRPELRHVKANIECLLNQTKNVYWHGRLNQLDLYKEFLLSGVWLYPTAFAETYCITALEVMAAGVYPIVSDFGALPETLNGFGTLVKGSPVYLEVRQEFLERVDDYFQGRLRLDPQAAGYALSQSWESLADEFIGKIAEVGA